jgi:hypothetical protein
MAKAFTFAGMALAATGLALSAPAAAAPATHASVASTAFGQNHTAASSFGDLTFDHRPDRRDRWDRSDRYDDDRYDRRDRRDRYQGRGRGRSYDDRYAANYGQPVRRDTRVWRGNDGRYYCRKDNGTTGLLIGAGVGALIGNEVAGRGDRTLGAILGAAGGALLGREIDRSSTRCR